MVEEVTEVDIRVFKTTLLARRFPGFQSLPDKDIRELVLADRKAAGRRLAVPQKSHPKSEFHPLSPKREQPCSSQPPFVCVNPAQAKEFVKRPDSQIFIGVGTPYDADRMDYMEFKNEDEAKWVAPFRPSGSSSQAKDAVKVDYFLNSPDAESKTYELRATRQRGKEMKESFMRQTKDRRGQTFV